MPSLEDLLATRRTAVKALEEKQRNLQSTTDYKDAVQDAVDTAWRAAAGGVALAQADDDPQFRGTLTAVIEELISGKRDRNILAEWKAGYATGTRGRPCRGRGFQTRWEPAPPPEGGDAPRTRCAIPR